MNHGVMSELERFVEAHRDCGGIAGDAEPPAPDAYRLWLVCRCRARSEWQVAAAEAAQDLLYSGLLRWQE